MLFSLFSNIALLGLSLNIRRCDMRLTPDHFLSPDLSISIPHIPLEPSSILLLTCKYTLSLHLYLTWLLLCPSSSLPVRIKANKCSTAFSLFIFVLNKSLTNEKLCYFRGIVAPSSPYISIIWQGEDIGITPAGGGDMVSFIKLCSTTTILFWWKPSHLGVVKCMNPNALSVSKMSLNQSNF